MQKKISQAEIEKLKLELKQEEKQFHVSQQIRMPFEATRPILQKIVELKEKINSLQQKT